VQKFNNDIFILLFKLCPESIFFTNCKNETLLYKIFAVGNFEAIDLIDQNLFPSLKDPHRLTFAKQSFWLTFAEMRASDDSNAFVRLGKSVNDDGENIEEEKKHIQTLNEITSKIGRKETLDLLLNVHSGHTLLTLTILYECYVIADYLMVGFPELSMQITMHKMNLWHDVASYSRSRSQKTDQSNRIEFFNKYFSNTLPSIDQKNKVGFTPLYIARHISQFYELADCFKQAGADSDYVEKFYSSKLLAHVWSISQKIVKDSQIHEGNSHLDKVEFWNSDPALREMQKTFNSYMAQRKDISEEFPDLKNIVSEFSDAISANLLPYLEEQITAIKKAIDQKKLWLIP
jgi:hypothetical protein